MKPLIVGGLWPDDKPPCDLECATCRYQIDPTHCADVVRGVLPQRESGADELEISRLRRERIEQESVALEMGGEIARLRHELDEARADAHRFREERDDLRGQLYGTREDLQNLRRERDEALDEALALRDRLSTIVDESFGLQEVLDTDALLSRLEHLLTERAHERLLVLAERDEARVALRDLIASVEATKTRNTIVLRDLEAARAVLGGQP